MHWQRGLKRLRIVATGALVLGAIMFFPPWLTNILGYVPNAGFVGLFNLSLRLGLMLLVLGALLWVAVWVLAGFLVPETAGSASALADSEPTRARFRE